MTLLPHLTDLLFLGFSTNLLLSCLLTIGAHSAVNALVALIFAFLNATCIFFLMELEFLGLLFLIVYVGAVSVLFLFSVMLFNLKDVVRSRTSSLVLKTLAMLLAIGVLFLTVAQWVTPPSVVLEDVMAFVSSSSDSLGDSHSSQVQSDIYYLGQVLYGRYLLYLILASLILLVAMVGAVVLINNPKEQMQMQHSLKQMVRSVQLTNLR